MATISEDNSVIIHLVKQLETESGNLDTDRRQLEEVMDVVQSGWRDEEIARQFLPHMAASYDFNSVDRTDQAPGPVVPEIRGLYVARDWSGNGELLADAALNSARRAALAMTKGVSKKRGVGTIV